MQLQASYPAGAVSGTFINHSHVLTGHSARTEEPLGPKSGDARAQLSQVVEGAPDASLDVTDGCGYHDLGLLHQAKLTQ